jgi:concanavalin A-like lectin/glucanase superfamily protein
MNTLYTRPCGPRYVCCDDFIRSPRCGSALLNALIAHWRLDEASGTRVDTHGGNNLGDINTVGQAAGKLGNAASFVAANEEALGVGDGPALSMGNIDFTIAGWVRFDTLASAGLAGKFAGGSYEYIVDFDGTNLRFHVSDEGTNNFSVVNSASISANTWYFFVAWHDAAANTINISVNNNAAASAAHSSGVLDGGSGFYLGRNEDALTYLNGRLDSVSIWKRVLTSAERTQLYNSGNGLDYPFN